MRNHAIFVAIAAPALLAAASALSASLPAQTPAPPATQTAATPAPVHKPVHPQRRRPVKPAAAAAAAPAPAPPPAPKPPDWPVNDPPAQAHVVFDSQGLRIQAENSSLDQILKEVSTDTGAKVEGLSKDVRIFGNYGPGDPRDVLSQLLDGSGYNVLLVGGQSATNPLQVLLSAPPSGPAPAVTPSSSPSEAEDFNPPNDGYPTQPPMPPNVPPGAPPGQQPRTPQQIMQELMQHQQQQQQQPQNPQN